MTDIERGLRKALFNGNPEVDARINNGIELNRKGTAKIRLLDAGGKEIPNAEIKLKQIRHEFDFGCNGFMIGQLEGKKGEAHDQAFSELFNLAVVPFYWSDLEVEDGKPRFDRNSPNVWRRPATDLALDFCDRYQITPKGHPLMWHSFIPEWLSGNHTQMKARWERRVREIAERYGSRIHNWDVVNESLWYDPKNRMLPNDYVEFAFDLAMRYLPVSDTLNYNDFVCWGNLHGNSTPAYLLLENLRLKGKKVDCMGLQYHMFASPEDMVRYWSNEKMNADVLMDTMDLYHKLGIPTNVSEVTITAHEALGASRLDFQADVAERLYRMWFSDPGMTGIIYWNLVDDTAYVNKKKPSWNENQYKGGLLNNDDLLSHKPAYDRLYNLIQKEWQSSGTVNYQAEQGNYFRGFHGTYEAVVKADSGEFKTTLTLEKNRPNDITIQMK